MGAAYHVAQRFGSANQSSRAALVQLATSGMAAAVVGRQQCSERVDRGPGRGGACRAGGERRGARLAADADVEPPGGPRQILLGACRESYAGVDSPALGVLGRAASSYAARRSRSSSSSCSPLRYPPWPTAPG